MFRLAKQKAADIYRNRSTRRYIEDTPLDLTKEGDHPIADLLLPQGKVLFRNPKPKPETRNPRPETRNPKPETRDPGKVACSPQYHSWLFYPTITGLRFPVPLVTVSGSPVPHFAGGDAQRCPPSQNSRMGHLRTKESFRC